MTFTQIVLILTFAFCIYVTRGLLLYGIYMLISLWNGNDLSEHDVHNELSEHLHELNKHQKLIDDIKHLKGIIEHNKDKILDRNRAYALSRAYTMLNDTYIKLVAHTSQPEAQPIIVGLGNLTDKATYYLESSHQINLMSKLEEHEQAEWVAYQLTDEEVNGTVKRTDDFREDKNISTGSASLPDYEGSGYDRGHLAPAADFKWSIEAMSESFHE